MYKICPKKEGGGGRPTPPPPHLRHCIDRYRPITEKQIGTSVQGIIDNVDTQWFTYLGICVLDSNFSNLSIGGLDGGGGQIPCQV